VEFKNLCLTSRVTGQLGSRLMTAHAHLDQ